MNFDLIINLFSVDIAFAFSGALCASYGTSYDKDSFMTAGLIFAILSVLLFSVFIGLLIFSP